jgi:hypothetical protein
MRPPRAAHHDKGTPPALLPLAPREAGLRLHRARPTVVPKAVAPSDEFLAMVTFVEDLARLAADLWFEGRLDDFATIEDPPDND